jgi:hypothetical protein
MSYAARIAWVAGLAAFAVAAVAIFVPPVPQDVAYHFFADVRPRSGVPNFADVASSGAFAAVGLFGLIRVMRRRRVAFTAFREAVPFAVFFLGVALVGPGSAYYHWAPGNEALFWDRLPMTVAFAALTSAVIGDRIHAGFASAIALPFLLVAGVWSVVYWIDGERLDRGDLRFYGLIQFLPFLLLPVVCYLFPDGRHTRGRYLAAIVAGYALAMAFDRFDYEVFESLGETVSGHTLKHVAAAVAAYLVLPMALARRTEWKADAWPAPAAEAPAPAGGASPAPAASDKGAPATAPAPPAPSGPAAP